MQIKLLVACREQQLALALCTRLTGGSIAAEATEMGDVLRSAAVASPDVLLLEYTPEEEERAWHVLSGLGQVSGSTRVLMLCEAYTHRMIIGFIRHGASGCLPRSSEPSLCAKAVRAVHKGEIWFGRTELLQALHRQMVAEPVVTSAVLEQHELLTAREREIMAFIGSALSNKEIARQLKISDKTVKTHLHHIHVKLQQSGRYKALLSNVLPPPSPRSAAPRGLQEGGFAGD